MKRMVLALVVAALPAVSCGPSDLGPPVAALEFPAAGVPLAHASSATIDLAWTPLEPLDPPDATPFLFVHLLDGDGRMHRTFDRAISGDFDSAEGSLEIWQTALSEPLEAGSYRLTAGVYDVATGRRWRLRTSAEEIDEGEYEIATIEVESAERQTPELAFEGEWHAPDDTLLQNPGRRWMGKSGSLRLLGTTGWSELALSLSITDLSKAGHQAIFEDEAEAPRLVIGNGCAGDSETRVDGYGVHAVTLAIDTEEDCVISFAPNFMMLGLDDFNRRSIGLEWAYFRPSAADQNSV